MKPYALEKITYWGSRSIEKTIVDRIPHLQLKLMLDFGSIAGSEESNQSIFII